MTGYRLASERQVVGGHYQALTAALVTALVVGVVLWFIGAPMLRLLGLAAVCGVVAALLTKAAKAPQQHQWPLQTEDIPAWGRVQRQWDVPGLDAALERPETMSRRILVQLSAIGGQLLARRGLTYSDPRAGQLLGLSMYLLTDPNAGPPTGEQLKNLVANLTYLAVEDTEKARPLPIDRSLLDRATGWSWWTRVKRRFSSADRPGFPQAYPRTAPTTGTQPPNITSPKGTS